MEKDFDAWNELKQKISYHNRVFFNKGEIWFASIGKNIGDEEDGKNIKFERPILIIRKFNNNIFLAIPLTTQYKENKYYKQLSSFSSIVILSQVRILDAKRLLRKIGKVKTAELNEIKNLIRGIV